MANDVCVNILPNIGGVNEKKTNLFGEIISS